jgi:hypothetical protein
LSGAVMLLAAALAGPYGPAETPRIVVVEPEPANGVALRALRARYLRQGEPIQLAAVFVSPADGRCRAPAGVGRARFEGRDCAPLPAETEAHLRWFEARPEARDYDNVRRCRGRPRPDCADPIAYRLDEIAAWRGRAVVGPSVTAAALGTHRYEVTLGATPAAAGDAIATWPELVVRRDDSYTGYVTELIGTPFVLWPTTRQVDDRLGADCSAVVVYGQRRLGRRVRYVSPSGLKRLTARVAAGRLPREKDPRSREPPVPVRVGDILHFGFQTAVVVEDRAPHGILTPADVVIHSYHGVAEEASLGGVPYAHFPFEIRRWTDR